MVLLWRVGSRKGCLESRYVIDLFVKIAIQYAVILLRGSFRRRLSLKVEALNRACTFQNWRTG